MKKLWLFLLALGVLCAALAWVLSAPNPLTEAEIAALPQGDPIPGELVFHAAGCASCHSAPKASGEAKKLLTGGKRFATPFGTFIAPNISSNSEAGIGGWELAQFANAMKRGISPDGAHYFPAFPYSSYAKITDKDLSDLWAYMKTLPPVDIPAAEHEVSFPFNIRRGLGFWKLLFFNPTYAISVADDDPVLLRGRYLAETLGHCGECHTPRNPIGGPIRSKWFAGGVAPEGNEKIPNITPHKDGISGWSLSEIENALSSGFTPEFDSLGSSMTDVVENMAKLSLEDRQAIASYLKTIPAIPSSK